jgi:hypothetical protein
MLFKPHWTKLVEDHHRLDHWQALAQSLPHSGLVWVL